MKQISYAAFLLLLTSCAHNGEQYTSVPPIAHQPPPAISPPTYVSVVEEEAHPDFNLTTGQINLPATSIENAIIAAFPHVVSIRYTDSRAHSYKVVNLRVPAGTTIAELLEHLGTASGYALTYDPQKRIVSVAGLIRKSWYLASVVGRGQTEVSLGEQGSGDDDEEGGESTSAGAGQRALTTTFDRETDVRWDQIVAQAACMLETPACSGGEDEEGATTSLAKPGQDGSLIAADRDQGLITALAPPEKIEALDAWLAPLAKQASRYLRLQVALVNIRTTDDFQHGFDLKAALAGSDGVAGFDYQANLEQGRGGALTLNAGLLRGNLTLTAILQLISERADSDVLHQATLIVPSGETAVLNSVETFYFVTGSEIFAGNPDQQQTIGTDLEQSAVGIELAITPRLLRPGSDLISVRVVPSISSLVRFDEVVSNGVVISSAPRLALNNFTSNALVRDGNAIVVGGLTSAVRDAVRRDFPGGALTRWLGASSRQASKNELLVIVLAQEIEA